MALKMQHQKIPNLSGVYFFKKGQKILYVGKAMNLKARLGSYHLGVRHLSEKIKALLNEATKLDWQVLSSETEALIKESEFIKKYSPKYNVLMRDDKQYFFVAFSKELYPKIYLTHQTPKGPEYLGPFTDGGAIKTVLKILRRVFPYCTCKKVHKTLCLNARIGRCLGSCCLTSSSTPLLRKEKGIISSPSSPYEGEGGTGGEVYKQNISSIKKILSGKNKTLLKSLKKEMKNLSVAQKYEEAGKTRDQIKSLEKIFAHKEIILQDIKSENVKAISTLKSLLKIKEIKRMEAYDIANIQGKYAYGSMVVFVDGQPAKDLYRIFKIKTVFGSNDVAMLKEVLTRRFLHKEWQFPDVILVDGGKGQLGGVIDVLNNSSPQPPSSYSKRRGARGVALIPNIKIIALTKNKKHTGDHIYISGKKEPLPLDTIPLPLKNLLLHIDSEAHRFAIKHYRQSHRKMLT